MAYTKFTIIIIEFHFIYKFELIKRCKINPIILIDLTPPPSLMNLFQPLFRGVQNEWTFNMGGDVDSQI